MPLEVIYLDNSTLSTFQTCQEKARIRYRDHWAPRRERLALSGGAAWHRAMEVYVSVRDARTIPYPDQPTDPLHQAKLAFIGYLQEINSGMPIGIDEILNEKRSVERYCNLLAAYDSLYRNEPFEIVVGPTGKPYTELGFALSLADWNGRPVHYVGKIDAIKRSKIDGRYYIFEYKTTTLGLGSYLTHTRPNHQITGYILAARELLSLDIAGCYWDCAYVSDRQPNPKKGNWMGLGIDIEKDFGRAFTDRSSTDFDEFRFDITDAAFDFLSHKDSGRVRWRRNTTACNMYGGCEYKELCASNCNPDLLKSNFVQDEWKPYEELKKEVS